METMIFRHVTDWVYHPKKGIVCSRCKTPIKISEAKLNQWTKPCEGCKSTKTWNRVSAFIFGLFVIYLFSYKDWL